MKLCIALLAIVTVGAVSAWAVQPVTTEHTTEADFDAAESTHVVVWSLGEVTLGAAAKTLLEGRGDIDAVTAVAVAPDGTVYVGTATKGLILRIAADGAVATVADLDSAMVTDLVLDGDRLLAATAGDAAGVYAVDVKAAAPAKAVTKLWSDDDAAGVWAIALAGKTVYAATAPNGKLYAIDAAGEGKAIFTAKQKVLRSILAGDAIYVGTGDEGLVYRIDVSGDEPTSRVVLDAEETEIVALIQDGHGNLYAAGTNVTSAEPAEPSKQDGGKPASQPASAPAGPTTAPATQPTTQPTSQPAAAAESRTYTIQAGDTLAAIAKSHYGDSGAFPILLKANPDLEPNQLRVGQVLAVPSPGGLGLGSDSPDDIDPAQLRAAVPAAAAAPTTRPAPSPAEALSLPGAGPSATSRPKGRPNGRAPAGAAEGNTIYRVDAGGLVKVVGKVPATILAMDLTTRPAERLVIATAAGEIRVIEVATGAAGALAKLDPKKVTALTAAADGGIYAGTTEPALVARIGTTTVREGTFISKPIDAKQIARWGAVHVGADVPKGAGVTVATRTGNVAEPTDETWCDWSTEIPVTTGWAALGSPAGRLLQYRLTLTRPEGGHSPVVDSVKVVHQVGNLPPEIEAVEVTATAQQRKGAGTPGAGEEQLRYRAIAIKAADPNADPLRFDLFYRLRGSEVWIRWEKEATTPSAVWDTRTAMDGVYEVKVVASDAAANPPASALTDERISRAIIVDNTPPRIAEIGTTTDGRTVRLTGLFTDVNRIGGVEYRLDSDETPVAVAAADGIFDSPTERVAVAVEDLAPGPHALSVKGIDEFGNAAYTTVTVTIAR